MGAAGCCQPAGWKEWLVAWNPAAMEAAEAAAGGTAAAAVPASFRQPEVDVLRD